MAPSAAKQTKIDPDARAKAVRDQMYANPQLMADIQRGYEESLRGEGISVEDYQKQRGLV